MMTKFVNVSSYIDFINALPSKIVYLSLLEKPKKPYKGAFHDEVADDAEYVIVTYTSIGTFVFKQPIDKLTFPKSYDYIKIKLKPKLVDKINVDHGSLTIGNFIDQLESV